ncbi:MAG: hypothetical protein ABIP68_02725, partial [Ferruginibacter sp.]
MKNNYLDWKKSNNNKSLEAYFSEVTTTDATQIDPIAIVFKNQVDLVDKSTAFQNPFNFLKRHTDIKTRIFIATTVIQLFIFSVIMFKQNIEFEISENAEHSNKNYLQEVKWGNYSISQEIAITLPFELKKSETVLPYYLN